MPRSRRWSCHSPLLKNKYKTNKTEPMFKYHVIAVNLSAARFTQVSKCIESREFEIEMELNHKHLHYFMPRLLPPTPTSIQQPRCWFNMLLIQYAVDSVTSPLSKLNIQLVDLPHILHDLRQLTLIHTLFLVHSPVSDQILQYLWLSSHLPNEFRLKELYSLVFDHKVDPLRRI